MPIDASIYNLQQPQRFNTPFENLSAVLQVRQQQDSAQALAEQRRAITEQRQAQTAGIEREAQRQARLTELFTNNPKPTRADIMKADPSENGQKIATAIEALQDAELKRFKDHKTVTREAIAGLNALPEGMRANGYGAIRQTFLARGWAQPEEIPEEYNPEFVSGVQKQLLSPEKQYDIANPKPIHVGNSLVAPDAKGGYTPVYTAPDKPKEGLNEYLDRYAATRRLKRDQLSDGDILKATRQYEAAGRAPEKPDKPTYEWANVGGENKLLTPDEIRKAGGTKPMTATEALDERKYKKADPVLRGISELSEKINTQQGMLAKMGGGAAKLAAKANYDDDVAEYTALVSGFTPMVARALGHTGVLTQQDVDSVKALFPLPGDSKTLRDRKMSRVLGIIGDLESATSSPAKAPPPATTGRIRVKGPNGETGTVPADSPLPPGWSKVGG